MRFGAREDILQITPLWTGERFADGRPKVPRSLLQRMERVTTEEAWSVLWAHGYKYQFEGGLKVMHPDRVLVGRAVTATLVPARPDLNDTLLAYGHQQEGRKGFFNSWPIETLVEDDVMVVDLFDKVFEGTFSGGNLSTSIAARTKRGQIIWGGIRDLQQIVAIENFQTYYRGIDPPAIRDVTLVGLNAPCRIGGALCLPGDVVLGTPSGVLFIPPHLAEECAVRAEKTRLRDIFGFERIRAGVYTTAQVDGTWTPEIWGDFARWRRTNTPDDLQGLDWTEEERGAREPDGPAPDGGGARA